MRFLLLAGFVAFLLFVSCNSEQKQAAADKPVAVSLPPATPESELGPDATAALMNVLSSYYNLKDALVATDAAKTDAAASKLLSTAEGFQHTAGDRPETKPVLQSLQTVMTESEAIIAAKSDAIETKRAHFSTLSDAMLQTLRKAKLQHGGVYQQYCPMALNDKGAYWLSAEDEIKNPYFGKKMLECGEVRDSL